MTLRELKEAISEKEKEDGALIGLLFEHLDLDQLNLYPDILSALHKAKPHVFDTFITEAWVAVNFEFYSERARVQEILAGTFELGEKTKEFNSNKAVVVVVDSAEILREVKRGDRIDVNTLLRRELCCSQPLKEPDEIVLSNERGIVVTLCERTVLYKQIYSIIDGKLNLNMKVITLTDEEYWDYRTLLEETTH